MMKNKIKYKNTKGIRHNKDNTIVFGSKRTLMKNQDLAKNYRDVVWSCLDKHNSDKEYCYVGLLNRNRYHQHKYAKLGLDCFTTICFFESSVAGYGIFQPLSMVEPKCWVSTFYDICEFMLKDLDNIYCKANIAVHVFRCFNTIIIESVEKNPKLFIFKI
ncbi:MAG: hypothetical protein ACRCXZ_03265 [Patescibacteria group bacterium]